MRRVAVNTNITLNEFLPHCTASHLVWNTGSDVCRSLSCMDVCHVLLPASLRRGKVQQHGLTVVLKNCWLATTDHREQQHPRTLGIE